VSAPRIGIPYLVKPRILGVLNQWRRADRGERIAYGLFGTLGVGFWIGLLAGLAFLVVSFHQVEVFGPLIAGKLLELMLVALFAMLCFSNIVTALSTFYLSEDLELLLGLPISRPLFHYGRIVDALGQSSWMMAFFGLPLFLAYGYAFDAPALYYVSLLAVVPAFLVLPACFGALVATVLVNVFPARRTREALGVMGVLLVVAVFFLLRVMKPERLVNAQDFESLAAYVAELQAPIPSFFPARWAADVLLAALRDRPVPLDEAGLLIVGAFAALAVTRWIVAPLYPAGWTKAQEARAARLAKSGWFDRLLGVVLRPAPTDIAPIIEKDVKVFVRDPSQWSQIFLLVALVGIYLFSVQALPVEVVRNSRYMSVFKSGLTFLNLGMTGFVMAGLAARFQFSAVSTEGRAFWMLRTAPITAERYLWAKAVPALLPMVVVGEILVLASGMLLDSPPALLALGAFNALLLAAGITGIAVGMGASFPNFKADNAAKVAGGPAGILFMVFALLLVGGVLLLEAFPVWLIIRYDFSQQAVTPVESGLAGLAIALAVILCGYATVAPIRRAAEGLWSRNL